MNVYNNDCFSQKMKVHTELENFLWSICAFIHTSGITDAFISFFSYLLWIARLYHLELYLICKVIRRNSAAHTPFFIES